MRRLKMIGSTVVAVVVLVSPASAVTWDPPGTVVHGHGNVTLTSGTAVWTCTFDTNFKGSGAVATTTNSAGVAAGPTFSNCTNNLGLSPMTVTSSAAWVATATSTTAVDLTSFNYTVNLGSGTCIVTVDPVAIPNNAWSNGAHTLTLSSATAYPITRAGFCPLTSGTGTNSGSFAFPASVVIT